VITVVLESGTFRTLAYDLNIKNSQNSIPTIGVTLTMSVSVSVLV